MLHTTQSADVEPVHILQDSWHPIVPITISLYCTYFEYRWFNNTIYNNVFNTGVQLVTLVVTNFHSKEIGRVTTSTYLDIRRYNCANWSIFKVKIKGLQPFKSGNISVKGDCGSRTWRRCFQIHIYSETLLTNTYPPTSCANIE